MSCSLCDKVARLQSDLRFRLLHEFETSYWILGDHQVFQGYSLLVSKHHVREMHELDPELQVTLFKELMTAGSRIAEKLKPWKMNYASYGNQVPHLHWHLIPRYESDPRHKDQPWVHEAQFSQVLTSPENSAAVRTRLSF